MFEAEIDFKTARADEIPEDIRTKFVETARIVSQRSAILWGEHCSECTMPACFTTCEFYDPRPDMKCRRFRGGVTAIDVPHSAVGNLVKITFRKWAKLEGQGTIVLMPTEAAAKRERSDAQIGRSLNALPLPYGAKIYGIRARQKLKERFSVQVDRSVSPNHFVVECYNPAEIAVQSTLTMRPVGERSRLPFQAALQFPPGYSRSLVPISGIEAAIDLSSQFLVQIEPGDEAGEVTLYFGLVDFAYVDDPANATRGKSEPAVPDAASKQAAGQSKSKHAKCVVWDLDNTLWAGTLIEDGIEKLRLNPHAVRAIHELDRRGILNSVASKNNPEDAIAVLKHFDLLDYFLHPQVSWGPKSQAVAAIANRLNIGIDTLVFVDDQPFERAEVATAHPSVRAVDALELERFLDSPFFDVPVTAESQARRAMYRQEIERSVALEGANGDYLEFLRGCGMHLTIATLAPDTVARVYELAQRTNQMNFSGNRYSLGAVEAMLADETIDAYVLRASDRFGDYGIIGFCVVEKQGPLMRDLMFSCRIQSKYVDRACLAYLIQTYAEAGQPRFEAIYNETPKNRPAAEVFWDFGFEKAASDGDHHRLVFDSTAKGNPSQDVVTVIVEGQAR